MRDVTISCIGKFHHFDLARELDRAKRLRVIYTGYPRWKLKNEELPLERIHTLPWFHAAYMGQPRLPFEWGSLSRLLGEIDRRFHGYYVSRFIQPAGVFVGLSGHNLEAGRMARSIGAKWVCDHGSTHILHNQSILAHEHAKWGIEWVPNTRAAIADMISEFDEADMITIPSKVVEQTFLAYGVSKSRLRIVPYGVNLSRFSKVASPKDGNFDVIFVGGVNVRKGVPYLIEAFRRFNHPRKSLTLIGHIDPAFRSWIASIKDPEIHFMGPLPQSELKSYLSRSHLFALPSVEEGLAMVQAQAMACGCPLVSTDAAGAGEIIADGVEGFIVPSGRSDVFLEKFEALAQDSDLRNRMSSNAFRRVQSMGGWRDYGDRYISVLNDLTSIGGGYGATI